MPTFKKVTNYWHTQ